MLNKGVGSVLFKDGVAWGIQTPENEVRGGGIRGAREKEG